MLAIDTDDARRELSDELWNPVYAGSWWERFKGWLADQLLIETGDVDLSTVFLVLAALATLAVGIGVVVAMRRRARQRAAAETGDAVFEGEHALTAREYRERAEAHAVAGRFDAAALDRYRAIGADAIEARLVTDSPDLTAHEVGAALARSYPDHADRAWRAGVLFDLVRYGGGHADADDVRALADLDAALLEASPVTGGRRDALPAVPR
ncbi:DUF4129 domain-containing protein [Mobilicoccus caccae]|uniref:Protein-glutamine gamma-glutamyltransferase-like C-terminal domain-containing protein n=1 Tax=Mobilicoccus caccae TaxID=1859295 RepID=A0ABQ6IMY0_9MICO|nr:DUF4129 domain-containing protein [Mobilicoccus caccae]GMA38563.1 hypothetical protein GCM10025883_06080 [Mobilicoccus caccae]